jgi:NAD(P)-dependent dehydrogenase (short-subunit alcohol dehydrogenase family)
MSNPEFLSAKRALVTGGGSGIGRALAHALLDAGARVCIAGRRADALAETLALHPRGADLGVCCVADLATEPGVAGVAQAALDAFGGLDILIHNAAFYARGRVETQSAALLDAHMALNVRAPYALTQALLPALEASQGEIAFINSTVVHNPQPAPELAQYAASKLALRAVADTLRGAVNPLGIRVLSIYVGRTATLMQASVAEALGAPYQPERLLQPADVARAVLNAFGMPRTAEITDLTIRPMQK